MWNTWKGDQHRVWLRLHREFGPFVRTGGVPSASWVIRSVLTVRGAGPNELSVVDAKAVVDVLGAGGIPKGECEYLSMRLYFRRSQGSGSKSHADRRVCVFH